MASDCEKTAPTRVVSALMDGARTLFPGYFGLVMATGIISVACDMLAMRWPAIALMAINWISYLSLCGLTLIRIFCFRNLILQDFLDHRRSPGFLTLVAATCVLGTQSVTVVAAHDLAIFLWWLGLGLWFVIMYTFVTAVTVSPHKPTLRVGISGAWLIAVVATQSVVILGAVIHAPEPPSEFFQLQMISMFLIGTLLYCLIIPLIFYRMTFLAMAYSDFSPPYWINMGALAISALAGSLLILRSDVWPLIGPLLPFVRGLTFFFWAAATWWIPFLLAVMAWRYLWGRNQFRYDPSVWGMVFPIGMYTASTVQFAHAMSYGFLYPIPRLLIFVALSVWALAMLGLLRRLLKWMPSGEG